MKLNYKRTFLVGLAFFSICAFWQLYDAAVPLMLKHTYHIADGPSGIVMSIDNVLALFMLPLFGAISDKKGRRMPFIIIGTVCAVCFAILLPFVEKLTIFKGIFESMDFTSAQVEAANFGANMVFFFIVLFLLLVSMGIYRSPAVALMPDVTPKPLRSKANAIINLMGAVGGVYTIGAVKLLLYKENGVNNYTYVFIAVAALMVIAVIALVLTVNERKLVAEMRAINYGVDPKDEPKTEETAGGHEKLPPDVRRSLILILASVALWFMGYNAITTAFSKYAEWAWGMELGDAATYLLIGTVGAVVSYLPIGVIASKIGRKKTILIGICLLSATFVTAAFVGKSATFLLYPLFVLVGFAWAAINVNSYPMVVEISKYGNVGKYTGYYYTFSMAAQIVTPIVSGYLLQYVGYETLFPYGAVFVAASFVTMFLTKHGDNKPVPAKTKLEAFDAGDD